MSLSDVNNKRMILQAAIASYQTAVLAGEPVAIASTLENAKSKGNDFALAVGGTAKSDIPGIFFNGTSADPYFSEPTGQDNVRRIFIRDALLGSVVISGAYGTPDAATGGGTGDMEWVINTLNNTLDTTLITLPFTVGSNVNVNWGDGNSEVATGPVTHNYTTGGIYTISMSGTITSFDLTPMSEATVLTDIAKWGAISINEYVFIDEDNEIYRGLFTLWDDDGEWYYPREEYTISATDAPNFQPGTSLARLFAGVSDFNENIGHWNMTNVINISNMFEYMTSFNHPLDNWDVSNVTNMSYLFSESETFNQDISGWDVSNVTDMGSMFKDAITFNQSLATWDVSNVTDMGSMFNAATTFNRPLNTWDVSNVITMSRMFEGTTTFNQDISGWNMVGVISISGMFANTAAFNQDISGWDTSTITTTNNLFSGAIAFNQPLNSWNMSSAIGMGSMFANATSFNQPLNLWIVSDAVDMSRMFEGAILFNQDISGWDTSSAIYMQTMLANATSFNQDLSGWDVANVSSSSNFSTGSALTGANLPAF